MRTAAHAGRPNARLEAKAKVFTIGAAYGFVAGVFVVALFAAQVRGLFTTGSVPGPTPGVIATGTTGRTGELTAPVISSPHAAELVGRTLAIPVAGVTPEQLTPQFNDTRGGRRHEAIDIMAPRGTEVRAVDDGRIARLFFSKAGGITIYQFDPSDRFCYYYAHLDRYENGLLEGQQVRRGQVLGYVGTSGNAPKDAPHLHFAVNRLDAERKWWRGTPVDPYDLLRHAARGARDQR